MIHAINGLGVTSDQQLKRLAAQLGVDITYIGYADDLEKLPLGFSIINLGNLQQGGTHWTLLYNDGNQIVYFDSYGALPEDSIIHYAKPGQRIM